MDVLAESPTRRAEHVKAIGLALGFDQVGVALPGPHPEMARFAEWLDRGYHGTMKYMVRHRRRREAPERALRGIKSVIMASLGYDTDQPRSTEVEPDPTRGWISRYAWGADYHVIIEERLDRWVEQLQAAAPGHRFMRYVDHGPILEKVFGRYAGLGWMGKHTTLIHPRRGSYFFLATILSDLELAADAPIADQCGSCTRCLDACPTKAFPEPYVLDARRCISYLTIETTAEIPADLQAAMGDHLFGCDICQDVCPWNRKPERPNRPDFQPFGGHFRPSLERIIGLTEETFGAAGQLEPDAPGSSPAPTPLARAGLDRLAARARAIKDHPG
jgi:epoxyqueuosine reductase